MAALRQQSGGIGDLAQAFAALAPVFLGQGKQTSNQTQTQQANVDLDAIASLKNTASQATVNANDPSITNDIVADIMKRAAISFAPSVGASKTAGLYNSKTLQTLGDNAKADAVAAASKATLDYRSSQSQIANQANQAIATATRSTTTSTSTTGSAAPTVPKGASLGLVAALLGGTAYKNKDALLDFFKADDNTDEEDAAISGAGGGGVTTPNVNGGSAGDDSLSDFSGSTDQGDALSSGISENNYSGNPEDPNAPSYDTMAASPVSFRDVGRVAGVVGSMTGNPALGALGMGLNGINTALTNTPALAAAKIGTGVIGSVIGGPLGLGIGLVGNYLLNSIFGKGTDVSSGLNANNADFAGSFNSDNIGAGFSGAGNGVDNDAAAGFSDVDTSMSTDQGIGSSLDDFDESDMMSGFDGSLGGNDAGFSGNSGDLGGGFSGDDGGGDSGDAGGSIICYELTTQGRLSRRWMLLGLRRFQTFRPVSKQAYYMWSVPVVRHLRAHPNSKFSSFIEYIFNHRAEYVAALEGSRDAKKTAIGYICRLGIACVCSVLAYTVCQFMKPRDHKLALAQR